MLNDMSLSLLPTFLEAARGPTFAQASKRLGLTPPAVTQRLKLLEARLGVALFERVGRSARLTEAGARVRDAIGPHLSAIDEALAAAVDAQGAVRGEVRIGAPAPFTRVWLRPRVAELMRAHPELVVMLRFGVPSVLLADLVAGKYDLCILVAPTDVPGVATRTIHVEEFVMVASPAYLRRAGVPRTAAELSSRPLIVYDPDLAMLAPWWRARFGRRQRLPSRAACYVTSLDEMLGLCEQGVGLTVLPTYFVADALARGTVITVEPQQSSRARAARNPIYLAWRRGQPETARIRTVRDALLGER